MFFRGLGADISIQLRIYVILGLGFEVVNHQYPWLWLLQTQKPLILQNAYKQARTRAFNRS